MKAIVRTRYGPSRVLQFADAPTPVPGRGEVLIQLCAASLNPLDIFLLKGGPWNRLPGLRTPKHNIIGCDIAGRVAASGENVKHFQVGDHVFGITGFEGRGFAEYVCASEGTVALKPARLTFEDAAALPVAAITALQGLRDKGKIRPGHKVLIAGASGGVGTFAVQIAKALGAEVTAVCSTRNISIARSLGADHVIDYLHTDLVSGGLHYDLVLAPHARHSVFHYRKLLTQNGIYVAVGGTTAQILQTFLLCPLVSMLGQKKMLFFIAKVNREDLSYLANLVEIGKIAPVIDRRYPLHQAPEALEYLAERRAQGKIVLTVSTAASPP